MVSSPEGATTSILAVPSLSASERAKLFVWSTPLAAADLLEKENSSDPNQFRGASSPSTAPGPGANEPTRRDWPLPRSASETSALPTLGLARYRTAPLKRSRIFFGSTSARDQAPRRMFLYQSAFVAGRLSFVGLKRTDSVCRTHLWPTALQS